SNQCSTSNTQSLRLALKLFRREPAISVFDWLFTPTHTSSPHFSTYVGSGLQSVLPDLHPGHGSITQFRAYDRILESPCSDSLSLRLRVCHLPLHTIVTRRSILQKVRRHPQTGSDYL